MVVFQFTLIIDSHDYLYEDMAYVDPWCKQHPRYTEVPMSEILLEKFLDPG